MHYLSVTFVPRRIRVQLMGAFLANGETMPSPVITTLLMSLSEKYFKQKSWFEAIRKMKSGCEVQPLRQNWDDSPRSATFFSLWTSNASKTFYFSISQSKIGQKLRCQRHLASLVRCRCSKTAGGSSLLESSYFKGAEIKHVETDHGRCTIHCGKGTF